MTKQLKVDNIVDTTGTGKPNFPVSPTSGGAALSTLNTHSYTSSASEPSSPKNGAIWWDSANSKVYVYANGEFKEITLNTAYPSAYSSGIAWGGARGFSAGGTYNSVDNSNVIDYWTMDTAGNASDFGDLTVGGYRFGQGCSNGTRVVWGPRWAASSSDYRTMDYITCATTGNAVDFGDYTLTYAYGFGGSSNGTRGLWYGGYDNNAGAVTNAIGYITIATTGNAVDFGDLLSARRYGAGTGDDTRGLYLGGFPHPSGPYTNAIEYITYASTGNSTDFGDLTTTPQALGAASDATRALGFGGNNNGSTSNVIQYVTTQTTGNATDFGDLLSARQGQGTGCGDGTLGVMAGGSSTDTNTIQKVTVQTTGNAADHGDLTGTAAFNSNSAGNAS